MSSTLRTLSRHTRSVSRTLTARTSTTIRTRAFHSPFAVLSSTTPRAAPPPPPAGEHSALYEKQLDSTTHPTVTASGTRHYVVSEPDPRATPYEVPYGAYPTSAPYKNFPPTDAPATAPRASTSPDYAHPVTTRAAPQNPTGGDIESGVQASAAVRNAQAPGQLQQGSEGGLGLMEPETTKPGEGELASRNPPPDDPKVAEKFSAMGVDNAWKARK